MTIESNACTCPSCPGPACTCGCQSSAECRAAACQCGDACACGPGCACPGCDCATTDTPEAR